MSIPDYPIYFGAARNGEFPPVASQPPNASAFQRHYVGSPDIAKRVKTAMTRYAAARPEFWRYPLLELALLILSLAFGAATLPSWGVVIVIVVVLGIGSTFPILIISGTSRASLEYALSGQDYAATFGDSGLYWKTSRATYFTLYTHIARVRERDGVVILGLVNSRAIVVLPVELLPDGWGALVSLRPTN